MKDKNEFVAFVAIAKRAIAEVFEPQGVQVQMIDILMDLEHVHELMPLRLDEFLAADAGNFGHDIAGIYRHFNRTTLQMDGCFVPRYTAQVAA